MENLRNQVAKTNLLWLLISRVLQPIALQFKGQMTHTRRNRVAETGFIELVAYRVPQTYDHSQSRLLNIQIRTLGVVTRGFDPPMAPGRIDPVSW